MPGSTSRGSTNTTRAPRSRIWRNACTGSATLRNDDLVTRGLEPIQSSSSVRSRSGMGVAVVAP